MMCLFPVPIEAASKKEVTKVERVVNNLYSAANNYNVKKMKNCFAPGVKPKFFESNKPMATFTRKYNRKYLLYKIRSTKVFKRTATVKVYCAYPNLTAPFEYAFMDFEGFSERNPNASSKTLNKKLAQYVNKEVVSNFKLFGVELKQEVVTIKLKKIGSSWKISSCPVKLLDSYNLGYESAWRAYF